MWCWHLAHRRLSSCADMVLNCVSLRLDLADLHLLADPGTLTCKQPSASRNALICCFILSPSCQSHHQRGQAPQHRTGACNVTPPAISTSYRAQTQTDFSMDHQVVIQSDHMTAHMPFKLARDSKRLFCDAERVLPFTAECVVHGCDCVSHLNGDQPGSCHHGCP